MKKRILVADDYEDYAGAMALALSLTGNDIRIARDGGEAIKAAEEFRPDLILLDIGMPVVDGYDVCEHIRQQPWGTNVILVAMTGWTTINFRERAIEAGFDHFFPKPVDTEALEQILTGTLEREKESEQSPSINPPTARRNRDHQGRQ